MKSDFNSLLLIVLFFLGLQIPQLAENYTISASAVVSELENDYQRMENMAKELQISIDEFILSAKKTDNTFAGKIVDVYAEKIPRYLTLKEQVAELKNSKNIFTIMKIVFLEHDPNIWRNVTETYKVGLYLNLDSAWYVFILFLSLLARLIINSLFTAFIFLLKPKKAKMA